MFKNAKVHIEKLLQIKTITRFNFHEVFHNQFPNNYELSKAHTPFILILLTVSGSTVIPSNT
jgi:hypothetical protein